MAVYTTIDDPSAYFQTTIYAGNGSADHSITNTGNSDLQPDWVWIKNRDATDVHCLFDSVRGVTKLLTTVGDVLESTDADILLQIKQMNDAGNTNFTISYLDSPNEYSQDSF